MIKQAIAFMIVMLAISTSGQTLKYCDKDSECTNFDGTNTPSCCYSLTGVNKAGVKSSAKLCDWTRDPQYPKYLEYFGF